jgi:hypothetical protein
MPKLILQSQDALLHTPDGNAELNLRASSIGQEPNSKGGEMPLLIEHIDAIARAKGRDVLMVTFPGYDAWSTEGFTRGWEYYPPRKQITEWLDENHIDWIACGDFANEGFIVGYAGQIYIDVPFDTNHATYRMLADYLENPDGTGKIEGSRFCYVPLSAAMKNKHHDEPGFWDDRD